MLAAQDQKEECCRSIQIVAGEGPCLKKMMEMTVILLVVMVAVSSSMFEAVAASGGLVVGMMEVVVDVTLFEQEVGNI